MSYLLSQFKSFFFSNISQMLHWMKLYSLAVNVDITLKLMIKPAFSWCNRLQVQMQRPKFRCHYLDNVSPYRWRVDTGGNVVLLSQANVQYLIEF